MNRNHFFLLIGAGVLVALVILLVPRKEDSDQIEFDPYAASEETGDTGLVPPTVPEMRRAKSAAERTRDKIERSRQMERTEEEPDDTLNRMGPTGNDISPPPDRPDSAGAAEGDESDEPPSGTLDKETIKQGIESIRPLVKACYEESLEEFPDAAGRVTVGFRVIGEEGEGRVELAELDEEKTTLFDERLHDCMMQQIGDATFDAPPEEGGVVNVTYPFSFATESDEVQDGE